MLPFETSQKLICGDDQQWKTDFKCPPVCPNVTSICNRTVNCSETVIGSECISPFKSSQKLICGDDQQWKTDFKCPPVVKIDPSKSKARRSRTPSATSNGRVTAKSPQVGGNGEQSTQQPNQGVTAKSPQDVGNGEQSTQQPNQGATAKSPQVGGNGEQSTQQPNQGDDGVKGKPEEGKKEEGKKNENGNEQGKRVKEKNDKKTGHDETKRSRPESTSFDSIKDALKPADMPDLTLTDNNGKKLPPPVTASVLYEEKKLHSPGVSDDIERTLTALRSLVHSANQKRRQSDVNKFPQETQENHSSDEQNSDVHRANQKRRQSDVNKFPQETQENHSN
ncbi:ribosome-binding protein 1-like [Octopus sinensis]|uniref:Ribosome-binding protein 1-like n=1 Tax=Octopus sinensis TaxID=2607531 RepID=A0A7E6F961_9MOLL|nr:ribosome-binding protein 1-like [Octopus sinensis]